ncbi:MAG: hypothetical protein KGJ17_00545, partial [Gammaproteobacteria bacterium]|nr:hypothetical protein [Gammaproteobacteria bacterium]
MAIRPEVLDELLQGTDAKQLFEKDGLLTELKKALAERVANYHRNTIRHFLWVIAAVGMNGPEDLKPEVLNRRVSLTEIRTYRELYPYL